MANEEDRIAALEARIEALEGALVKVDDWGADVDKRIGALASGCMHGFPNRAYCPTCAAQDREQAQFREVVSKVPELQARGGLQTEQIRTLFEALPRPIRESIDATLFSEEDW